MNVKSMIEVLRKDVNQNSVVQSTSFGYLYNIGHIRTSREMNDEMHCMLLEQIYDDRKFDPSAPDIDIYAEDLPDNKLVIRYNDNDGSFLPVTVKQFLSILVTHDPDLELVEMCVDGYIDTIVGIIDINNLVILTTEINGEYSLEELTNNLKEIEAEA